MPVIDDGSIVCDVSRPGLEDAEPQIQVLGSMKFLIESIQICHDTAAHASSTRRDTAGSLEQGQWVQATRGRRGRLITAASYHCRCSQEHETRERSDRTRQPFCVLREKDIIRVEEHDPLGRSELEATIAGGGNTAVWLSHYQRPCLVSDVGRRVI
jgi:hypothetical protein